MSASPGIAPRQYSDKDVTDFIRLWKDEMDLRNTEIYSQYLNAAMSGIVTIIITIGLTFDKLSALNWFERGLIGAALILLLLAVGNVMWGRAFSVNGRLELLTLERQLILQGPGIMPPNGLAELDTKLNMANARAQQQIPYAYWLILLAIGLGTLGFFILLIGA